MTLAKAMDIAQGMEVTKMNIKKLKGRDMDYVHLMGPHRAQTPKLQQTKKPCCHCGGTGHLQSACRFKDTTCDSGRIVVI